MPEGYEHMNSDEVRDKIADHIQEIIHLLDGGGSTMVSKFVVIAEALDSDGDYGIWCAVNKGAMCHQTLGLTAWMTARENEHIAQFERHDHG